MYKKTKGFYTAKLRCYCPCCTEFMYEEEVTLSHEPTEEIDVYANEECISCSSAQDEEDYE